MVQVKVFLNAYIKSAVEYMRVTGWESKLVGFGCDGTNANIGERGGLKGHLKEAV